MLWDIDHNWTLFLDRDGVINKRIMDGYVRSVEEFIFLPGADNAVAELSRLFKYVFVVTNQQGIAKGLMTERNLEDVHDYMQQGVRYHEGHITKCYFAPDLASANSGMRKPEVGMGLLAKSEFDGVEFERSVMVGDSDSDIEFGKRLGMKTVKVASDLKDESGADLVVRSLAEFEKLLINAK